jgi:hypothetical protein
MSLLVVVCPKPTAPRDLQMDRSLERHWKKAKLPAKAHFFFS